MPRVCQSAGAIQLYFLIPVRRRAAAFCTDWRLHVDFIGSPASTLWQWSSLDVMNGYMYIWGTLQSRAWCKPFSGDTVIWQLAQPHTENLQVHLTIKGNTNVSGAGGWRNDGANNSEWVSPPHDPWCVKHKQWWNQSFHRFAGPWQPASTVWCGWDRRRHWNQLFPHPPAPVDWRRCTV